VVLRVLRQRALMNAVMRGLVLEWDEQAGGWVWQNSD
jgi:hypothetical protein